MLRTYRLRKVLNKRSMTVSKKAKRHRRRIKRKSFSKYGNNKRKDISVQVPLNLMLPTFKIINCLSKNGKRRLKNISNEHKPLSDTFLYFPYSLPLITSKLLTYCCISLNSEFIVEV